MPEKMSDSVMENEEAADCLLRECRRKPLYAQPAYSRSLYTAMGITSENVAAEYGITRQEQDEFAAKSHNKAEAAQKAGKFKDEIVPVTVLWSDPKSGDEKEVTVAEDEGIRAGVTAESLSKLKPAFSKSGTTTAGSSSQVSDGAAAVLLARRSVAEKLGLPIVGKFVQAVAVGVPPKVMGIGPVYAIRRLWEKTGTTDKDIDFYEINEAFASQAVYSVKELGLSFDKVNPNGGAIALGRAYCRVLRGNTSIAEIRTPLADPLGCTGSRQVATGMAEAKRSGANLFVTSMCIVSRLMAPRSASALILFHRAPEWAWPPSGRRSDHRTTGQAAVRLSQCSSRLPVNRSCNARVCALTRDRVHPNTSRAEPPICFSENRCADPVNGDLSPFFDATSMKDIGVVVTMPDHVYDFRGCFD